MLRNSFIIGLGLLWAMSSLLLGEVELQIVRLEQSVEVSFPTKSGKAYQVFTSTHLDSGEWGASGDRIEGTGEVHTFRQNSGDSENVFFKVEEFDRPLTIDDLVADMVPISPGTFIMGSPPNEAGYRTDEGPQTIVTISKPFWMSKYEVTQGQYQELMGNSPLWLQNGGLNVPADYVSWKDAVEFCRQLTEREQAAGDIPDDLEYRLPTEAQWEYACRAETTTRFSYGDDPRYQELGKYARYSSNSDGTSQLVGEKLANPWGLHDMYGNVYEWCTDWFGDYPGGGKVDPVGPDSGSSRVIRGSSWDNSQRSFRSAIRSSYEASNTDDSIGFRLVLVSVDSPKSSS